MRLVPVTPLPPLLHELSQTWMRWLSSTTEKIGGQADLALKYGYEMVHRGEEMI